MLYILDTTDKEIFLQIKNYKSLKIYLLYRTIISLKNLKHTNRDYVKNYILYGRNNSRNTWTYNALNLCSEREKNITKENNR